MNVFQIKIDQIMWRIILSFSLTKYTTVKVPFNCRKKRENNDDQGLEKYFPGREEYILSKEKTTHFCYIHY